MDRFLSIVTRLALLVAAFCVYILWVDMAMHYWQAFLTPVIKVPAPPLSQCIGLFLLVVMVVKGRATLESVDRTEKFVSSRPKVWTDRAKQEIYVLFVNLTLLGFLQFYMWLLIKHPF